MSALFAEYPDAVARTIEVSDRCNFSLNELRYEYPEELCPRGLTPIQHLINLTWRGAKERYPRGVPDKVRGLIEHELKRIDELNYAAYFLTVWDLVRFARERGILCQGRGSAANSVVCFCLGVTSVDPDRIDVLFERFISKERGEAPDIDHMARFAFSDGLMSGTHIEGLMAAGLVLVFMTVALLKPEWMG